MKRILCSLMLVLGLLHASVHGEDAPVPPPVPSILIYSDQSPGAIPYAEMWRTVGSFEGTPATTVTSSSGFIDLLQSGPWSHVVVTAGFSAGEPSYGAALRQYAALHHNVPIWLFISQDIGTNSGPGCTVCGATAITLWQNGASGGGYALGNVEQPHRAHRGYVFPDFAEVSPVDSMTTSSEPVPLSLSHGWAPMQQAIIVADTEAEPCDPSAPGGPEGEDAGAAPGTGGAGPGAAPAFLGAGTGDPMYCTKCVDNAQIQSCIENIAQPECNSIRLGIDRDRDAMLAYVNNVVEPMLLAQCNYWSCAALRWACRNGAYATTGLMRKAIEATWLAAVEELNWIVCPRLEADCVDAWSCLVQDGEQCPAAFPTIGDSGIPCYSEDLASLGCQ